MQAYPYRENGSAEEQQAKKFLPFAGTEGYTPVSYAPYIVAGGIAKLFDFDFPNTLLLMRILGVLVFTAIAAYAIKITPALKWAFVLIALLPVSLYNRSVLSADGAALSYALVVTAASFSAVQRFRPIWERSLWMTLCALSKQPQIIFILLELMAWRRTERRRWSGLALVVVPSLILSPLWVLGVSADVAAWRLMEAESHPREHFDPLWKLALHVGEPIALPACDVDGNIRLGRSAVAGADRCAGMARHCASALDLHRADNDASARVSAEAASDRYRPGTSGFGKRAYPGRLRYSGLLIFFITYTPIDIDHVRGVQGRYFVIALPLAPLFLAAITNVDLPRRAVALTAIVGSSLSGISTARALFEAHWSMP